jgi:hypothetical protein
VKKAIITGAIILACMDGVLVNITKDIPNGLFLGDNPRYEITIVGTEIKATPWKSSIKTSEDSICFSIENHMRKTLQEHNQIKKAMDQHYSYTEQPNDE